MPLLHRHLDLTGGRLPFEPVTVDWTHPMAGGLKAFWLFQKPAGAMIDVAMQQPLTNTSTTLVTSSRGIAVRSNGSTSYIASANNTFLDAANITVLIGVTPQGSLVALAPIIARWDESTNHRCWSMVCNSSSGDIRIDYSSDGASDVGPTIGTTGQLAVGRRTVVGMMLQGTGYGTGAGVLQTIWVDGIFNAQSTGSTGALFSGSNNPVQVGHAIQFGGSARFGQNDVDFVAIWNRWMPPVWLNSLSRNPAQLLRPARYMRAIGPVSNAAPFTYYPPTRRVRTIRRPFLSRY